MTTTEDNSLTTTAAQQLNAKKKPAMVDMIIPQYSNSDGHTKHGDSHTIQQPWLDGLMQPTTTGFPPHQTQEHHAGNQQKMAMHRRGMSLDETRVSSGLVGVGASQHGSIHDSAGSAAVNSNNTQFHRRVLSHNSGNTFYASTAQQQQRYPYSYTSGPPLPSLSQSVTASGNQQHQQQQKTSSTTSSLTTNNKSLLPEVKFVNSTVEALEDQIRKEDAPKKKRTRTTPEQLRILQKAFNTDPMPNSGTRVALAKKLGMNARAVQVWFQNRRAKAKLEAKRAECGGVGSGGSGTDSPHPPYLNDDFIDDDVDPTGGCGDDYLGTEDPLTDFENVDDHHNRPFVPNPSYRATNRSLKATGMVGRMAFPPDLDYLHGNGNGYNQQYSSNGYYQPSYQPHAFSTHNHLTRSFSLPYLEGVRDFTLALDPSSMMMGGGTGMEGDDDSLCNGDSTGMLSRSDSAPFAPYEFASGSGAIPIVGDGDLMVASSIAGRPIINGTTSRTQSLPSVDPFQDDPTNGLVDLMPPMDDPVWPTITIPDPYHQHQNNGNGQNHSQGNVAHMRRSYSLPNVYHPDYYPQMMYEVSVPAETTADQPPTVPQNSSRSQTPDYLPAIDAMDLTTPPGNAQQHRRVRSLSISHNPDYPENLNDFLTGNVSQYDD